MGQRQEIFLYQNVSWDISPDGQQFLMVKRGDETRTPGSIAIVLNWFEELKARVPAGR